MVKKWAIAIGINQYEFMQPLKYGKWDAWLMQEILRTEVGCERTFFFSDDSSPMGGKSTRPNRANLLQAMEELFENPFMKEEDRFWFFFSGHGLCFNGCDYLMPSDGDPNDIEGTAIPVSYISERLRRCGADNIILVLDACRYQGIHYLEGIGKETAEQARQAGIVTILSCDPKEYSYEIESLRQGAFTHALVEALGIQGKCATIERLNQYLSSRVPELNRKYGKPSQTPYIVAEPAAKSHLIILPQYATLDEIATFKNQASSVAVQPDRAPLHQDWMPVQVTVSGREIEAINRDTASIEQSSLPTTPVRNELSSPLELSSSDTNGQQRSYDNHSSWQEEDITSSSLSNNDSWREVDITLPSTSNNSSWREVDTAQPYTSKPQSRPATVQARNKLILGGVVILIGLLGLFIYKYIHKQPVTMPSTEQSK